MEPGSGRPSRTRTATRNRRLLMVGVAVLAVTAVAGCGGGGKDEKPSVAIKGTIVFATPVKGDHADINVLDGDGTRLVASDGGAVAAAPVWSPYGGDIAYITDKNRLSVVRADGGAGVLITPEPSDPASAPQHPAWLPNGTISYQVGGKLVIVQPTGTRVRELTPANPDTKDGTLGAAYAWSPDGKQMIFDCGGAQQTTVCVMDVASGKSRVLFAPRWKFGTFGWSPDGRTVVAGGSAHSDQTDPVEDVYVFDANGKNLHALAQPGTESDPAWSPDGKTIVYQSDRDPSGLWMMNADGSGAQSLLGQDGATHPDWVAP